MVIKWRVSIHYKYSMSTCGPKSSQGGGLHFPGWSTALPQEEQQGQSSGSRNRVREDGAELCPLVPALRERRPEGLQGRWILATGAISRPSFWGMFLCTILCNTPEPVPSRDLVDASVVVLCFPLKVALFSAKGASCDGGLNSYYFWQYLLG